MQVQAINNQNNKTSFGAIYQPKNINFNKVQEPIAEAIKKAMREPLQKFKGETAEGFYKSKGLDFEIAPYSSESVSLFAYRGLKESGTGVDRRHTYSDKIYIGEYDQSSEYRISDIETGLSERKQKDISIIKMALIPIIGMAGLIAYYFSNHQQIEPQKTLIENVDSVANKAKAIKPILEDSFKLGKKVIRK